MKIYTAKEAVSLEDGNYSMCFTGEDGKAFTLTGTSAEHLADSCNEMALAEHERIEAAKHYPAAVETLLEASFGGGSGAWAASQVLLSAYNSNRTQLEISDLCSLDANNFRAAMRVMEGRVKVNLDPSQVIEDGKAKLVDLVERFPELRVENRYK